MAVCLAGFTTHIHVQKPDLAQRLGQGLLRPVTGALGKSYRIEGDAAVVRSSGIVKRLIVLATAILFFPVTLTAGVLGAILLSCSTTYKAALAFVKNNQIQVTWKQGRPEIRTERLLIRPIRAEDLPAYQKLFHDATAMRFYVGGPRDITARFNIWLKRWNEHPFSALAIVDAKMKKVIGHVVLGHGDFEGDLRKGNSEVACVIDPAYWNANHLDPALGIGAQGQKHVGTEVGHAVAAFVKSIKERRVLVPCDVTAEQREELERVIGHGAPLRVHRNEEGQIDWIYLPLKQVAATTHILNTPAGRILDRIFIRENQGQRTPKNAVRNLFVVNV